MHDISNASIGCLGCSGDDYITNEIWVADITSFGCPCWVEAGYSTELQYNSDVYYFWADMRQYLGYANHLFDPVSSSDTNAYYVIYASTAPEQWNVEVFNNNNFFEGVSTDNNMEVGDITIGQELSGSSNANAQDAHFTNSGYYTGPASNLTLSYFSNGGSVQSDDPPFGGWVIVPNSSSSQSRLFLW